MNNKKNSLLVIGGPTASGKSALAIEVAKKLGGEIISADSMQVYKYMDIGTAKPTTEEMQGIPHYMLSVVHPSIDYNVTDFVNAARLHIEDIQEKGKIPIICGGTVFYINSLIYNIGLSKGCKSDEKIRGYYNDLLKETSPLYIHSLLLEVDRESAQRLHPNDTKRVIRALEIFKLTGKEMSLHIEESRQNKSPYRLVYIAHFGEREALYKRINERVSKMLEKGLWDEVKNLLAMGITKNNTSMQAIGYKEMLEFIEGNCRLDEAAELIKMQSRRYAKRQISFLKQNKSIIPLDFSASEITLKVCEIYERQRYESSGHIS